ncbi:MAG: hypothetical protein II956_01860 [Bacteroidales bacterium]|nr:hypothetical protein [Bacteroidales bacterium]
MKKSLLTFLLLFVLSGAFAQKTLTLTGKQFKQKDKDAVLVCEGLKITSTMLIDSVLCDCDGFWIMKGKNGDKPVKAFWVERFLPRAKNFELKPETYFIYPNLKEDADSAFVKVWLRKKNFVGSVSFGF